ncbi:histone H2B-like [Sitodiplosis mosellana]|uniref:histone H2B-like n=1 Tax=Sitodiplosis mosellana TaxID=263140 RepID=UPI0024442C75|nr:histone H2B-like [Sitodiplosis mosellana]
MARTAKKADKKEAKAEKSIVKQSKKSKKSKESKPDAKKPKKRTQSYGPFLYRVLKQVHESTDISNEAMDILNDFMNDIFERIANEASVLTHRNKSKTLGSRDIMTAVKLLFAGELARHALAEANQALARYKQSYGAVDKKTKGKKVKNNEENDEEDDEEENEENDEEDDESEDE